MKLSERLRTRPLSKEDAVWKLNEAADLLDECLAAWDSLPEGNYAAREVEVWLRERMAPVMNKLRSEEI